MHSALSALFCCLAITVACAPAAQSPVARPAAAAPAPAPTKCTAAGDAPLYTSPGCGEDVTPRCAPIPPPCAGYVCGCDGKTRMTFCGGVDSTKFASLGACPGDRLPP